MNPFNVSTGDEVFYRSKQRDASIVRGLVVECKISPLGHVPRVRVVDFASEMKDEEAGRWVDASAVYIKPEDVP